MILIRKTNQALSVVFQFGTALRNGWPWLLWGYSPERPLILKKIPPSPGLYPAGDGGLAFGRVDQCLNRPTMAVSWFDICLSCSALSFIWLLLFAIRLAAALASDMSLVICSATLEL